jgi:hypothetical protein
MSSARRTRTRVIGFGAIGICLLSSVALLAVAASLKQSPPQLVQSGAFGPYSTSRGSSEFSEIDATAGNAALAFRVRIDDSSASQVLFQSARVGGLEVSLSPLSSQGRTLEILVWTAQGAVDSYPLIRNPRAGSAFDIRITVHDASELSATVNGAAVLSRHFPPGSFTPVFNEMMIGANCDDVEPFQGTISAFTIHYAEYTPSRILTEALDGIAALLFAVAFLVALALLEATRNLHRRARLPVQRLHDRSLYVKPNRYGGILSVLLAAAVPTFLAWLVTFRELPLTSGWLTFPLQSSEIPYKDYFDPAPPLTYFEAQITAASNFGLHNYELLTLCIVPMYGIACFSLARRFFANTASVCMAVLMEVILLSLRLEQVGGWNTQLIMLSSIGFVLFASAVLDVMERPVGALPKKTTRIRGLAFGAGFFFALSMIEKQTVVLTLAISGVVLLVLLFLNRSNRLVQGVRYVTMWTLLGTTPVFCYTLYFLVSHAAFTPFVRDMLSGGGKNPDFVGFFRLAAQAVESDVPLAVWLSLAGVLVLTYAWRRLGLRTPVMTLGSDARCYGLLVGSSFLIWRFSAAFDGGRLWSFIGWDLVCSFLATALIHYGRSVPKIVKLLALLAVLGIPVVYDFQLGGSAQDFLLRLGPTGQVQVGFMLLAVLGTTVVVVARGRLGSIVAERYPARFRLSFSQLRFLVILCCAFSIGSMINLYSSGGGIYIEWFFPQAVVYFGIFVLLLSEVAARYRIPNFTGVWPVLLSISALTVTLISPYSWFNWSELGVLSPHTSSHLPNAYGFQLTSADYSYYGRVDQDADLAALLSGAGPRATVFSFPNIVTAATTTGLANYTAIKCVLLWFDTCPNAQAASDLRTFEKDPPNVVIWDPIPSVYVTANEKTFVRGKSALVAWNAYRLQEVDVGAWCQVDAWSPSIENGWETAVYAVLPTKGRSGARRACPSRYDRTTWFAGDWYADHWFGPRGSLYLVVGSPKIVELTLTEAYVSDNHVQVTVNGRRELDAVVDSGASKTLFLRMRAGANEISVRCTRYFVPERIGMKDRRQLSIRWYLSGVSLPSS